MGFETVSGYCWPQSIACDGTVALHLSSAGGREVQVEVARVGGHRDVVWSGTVPAGDHEVPPRAYELGCGWPAAHSLTVDPSWRSGYYGVVLTIDVDGKARRDHAFFVVRPSAVSYTHLTLPTSDLV